MVKSLKSKKPKLTTQEILNSIVDKEALATRKAKQVVEVKKEIIVEEEKVETFKWWLEPMDKKLFSKKKIGSGYYGHYEYWGNGVWIGAYSSSKELDLVIKSYIEETKKPVNERKIENIKSIILKDE